MDVIMHHLDADYTAHPVRLPRRAMRSLLLLPVLAVVAAVALLPNETASQVGPTQTPPNFKVAFIGDQAIGQNAVDVLELIQTEGADMVLHQGDLGYGLELVPQTAIDWDEQITNILGDDFPYFASIGNHDVGNWATYQSLLVARLGQVAGASCTGDYGVMATCTYQGLYFILSGAGSSPIVPDYAPHIDYIQDQLAADNSIWRICAWHKNQTAMQVGSKPNEVGWGPYEACRQGRAIIATAHEHSYSRTKTLSNVQTQTVDSLWTDPNDLRVSAGSTFVFVSGLGGHSIRHQKRCLPTTPPYGCNGEWASIYTFNQGATYGALFIEFHVDGDPAKASGYFKDIDGDVIDSFTITSEVGSVGGFADGPTVDEAPLEDDAASGSDTYLFVGVTAAIAASAVAFAGGVWYVTRRRGR